MVTRAPSSLYRIYTGLENTYGSAVKRGGIVGDTAHAARGGFHISRQDQPSTNYSVQTFNKNGPSDLASAIDITTTTTLMRTFSGRLRKAVDGKDPRVWNIVFEWFGTLNNDTVTGDLLYDTANRQAGRTSSDSSHLWHVHISFRRDRVTSNTYIDALLDVLLGVPPLPQEDEMPTTKELLTDQLIPHPNPTPDDQYASLQDILRWIYFNTDLAEEKANDIYSEVNGVEEGIAAVTSKVDAVNTRVASVSAAVDTLSKSVVTYSDSVKALNEKLDRVLAAIQEPTDEPTAV